VVLGTHPLIEGGLRLNRGFYWTSTGGYHGVHDKYYLPNEEGFYERCWFDRGRREFTLARVQEMAIGFLICSEVMFNEWARYYGRQGANMIAVPLYWLPGTSVPKIDNLVYHRPSILFVM
jgi:predicted amidohydrolase